MEKLLFNESPTQEQAVAAAGQAVTWVENVFETAPGWAQSAAYELTRVCTSPESYAALTVSSTLNFAELAPSEFPAIREAVGAELVPFALGYRDPVRERVEARREEG